MGVSACSEPLEFADWTIPVPEGTRVIEYAAVPTEDRTGNVIEVVEDLVIGNEADPDYRFYRALGIGAAGDGTIYVYDAGNYRIQVFDAEGEFVRTIGRRGGGPGEMSRDGGHFVVGEETLYHHDGQGTLTSWDRRSGTGRYKGGVGADRFLWDFGVTDAGEMFAIHTAPEPSDDALVRAVARVGSDTYQLISMLPSSSPLMLRRTSAGGVRSVNTRLPAPESDFAVDPKDGVYFTAGVEYQIARVSADGTWNWALRVAWPRLPVEEADIEDSMENMRDTMPDAMRSEVDWPEHLPALSIASKWMQTWDTRHPLRLDGNGNLYVFPLIAADKVDDPQERDPAVMRPVDVYSPDGELLFAGMMPEISWADAEGEYVYGLKFDRAVEEQRAVRYRIRRPWLQR